MELGKNRRRRCVESKHRRLGLKESKSVPNGIQGDKQQCIKTDVRKKVKLIRKKKDMELKG